MSFFRPQLESLEERCTPSCFGDFCSLTARLGHSPNLLTVAATTATLTVPNGHIVAYPPSPIAPPNPIAPPSPIAPPVPIRQEVLQFLESNGQAPPQPIIPGPAGLFVAAHFIDPSAFITGGGTAP